MDTKSQRRKSRDGVLSSLNTAIDAMNIAKDVMGMTPAKAAFGSVGVLLTMIKDTMINEVDLVDLGLACADVCRALDRGMGGRPVDELSQSVFEAIQQLVVTVAEIQRDVVKRGKRNPVSRLFRAKQDKETISAWRLELNQILHVFNTELSINTHVTVSDVRRDVVNTHTVVAGIHHEVVNTNAVVSDVHQGVVNTHAIVSDIHRTIVRGQEGAGSNNLPIQTSVPGESPPPPPRACFGRDELIEKIVGLAVDLTPVALIGAGGIGKTSIALTVLHHDRIKARFGDSRWFIRCDQFPASCGHFLNRLSEVVGAGIKNPEDLTPLRPFLSSREMIVFLDNAESILDPQGTNALEIYAAVEELNQFNNLCLCITSRISTIPTDCKRLDVPTLSMDAACRSFYRIYDCDERSDRVNSILEQLDFHPLSITLLATVSHHNKWDINRLTREWERQRTAVLHTQHERSLAATIELSLISPMFHELSPDARGLLGVVAFFPQGVNENNLDWLFPTFSNITKIFDTFCVLSLTYRSNGYITMLAPLRDYLRPQNPQLSPLLYATRDRYFHRLSTPVDPALPGFVEARWITSEDVNIEHLLDVLTSADTDSAGVWDVCIFFMAHLYWHKQRLVVFGPKIEALLDDHPSKPRCLFELSRLFDSVGNHTESKRLLVCTLKSWRERGDDRQVANTLTFMSGTDRVLGLHKEGIERTKEALTIYERLNDTPGQARSWQQLAWSLYNDNQLDAAEEAASRVISIADRGGQFPACECYRILGNILCSKGEVETAINHFETALGIASRFNWQDQLFWNHYRLARLFFDENRFGDAHAHIEKARSHAVDDPYRLGRAMLIQAEFWYAERKFEEAKSGALYAAQIFENAGATMDLRICQTVLRDIEEALNEAAASR